MKSAFSTVALVASLLSAVNASPLLVERDAEADVIEYKVVTDVQVVTAYATAYATEGAPPAETPVAETTTVPAKGEGRGKGRYKNNWQWERTTVTTTSSSTSSTPPPPPPPTSTSSSEAEVVYYTPPVVVPQPEPTTTSTYVAPVVVQTPTPTPSPASSAPSAYTGDDSYSGDNLKLAIINSTNVYRSMFQAKPLAWNQSLVDMAAHDAKGCQFEHTNAGQNLAAGYSGPQGAVGGWGDEYKTFNFASPDWSESCGHFTQLVWQDSTTVGCAAYKCPTDGSTPARGWYLICNYFPVGNMLGEFPENVKSKTS